MSETLLTQSSIKLFGRTLDDLKYAFDPTTVAIGANNFMRNQLHSSQTPVQVTGTTTTGASNSNQVTALSKITGLAPGMLVTGPVGTFATNATIVSVDATNLSIKISSPANSAGVGIAITASTPVMFARIYAFSYEGAVYTLSRASIFLVHGPGLLIDNGGNRTTMDQSGVLAREWEFAGQGDNHELRYWEYEKGDFSLRLDPESGPLEQILLQAALNRGADRADRSGQGLDVRSGQGLDVRSGQGLRTNR